MGTSGLRVFAIAFLVIGLCGCATSHHATTDKLNRRAADLRVLLMPPDITLAELTAGGVLEPNAEWTAAAKAHVNTALMEFVQKRNAQLMEYSEPLGDTDKARLYTQFVKLNSAVGLSILAHQYQTPLQLPTKKDKFAWSLGKDVEALANDYNADYALFVYLQDSYSSAGRVVAAIFAAALGVGLPGGQQVGFASLVDLRTGDIVWFNRLARGAGDLRQIEPAKESVDLLMNAFPT